MSAAPPDARALARRASAGDDEALLALLAIALEGDAAAQGGLFEVLTPTVRAAARGVLGARRPAALDDAVQQARLRLLEDDLAVLRRFHPERGALHGFVYVVATNVAKTWASRERPADSRPPLSPAVAEPVDPRSPEDPVHFGDRLRKIRAAWDAELAPRERFLAALVLLDGKEVAEAARLAGVSPQTVSNALSRARKVAAQVRDTNIDHATVE